ncbi:MAG: GNAT family N-acetyltransferase [Planctomycetota bacterium]|nr:GNAT family N-acetyltransferase [Planctomycetota bacterium]
MVFESVRLILHEIDREQDLEFLAALLGHPEVMRYWPAPMTREESIAWIERQVGRYERDGFGYWLVSLKESGQPIGQAGLMRVEIEGESCIGLGYIIHADHWGKGYATEAAKQCLEYGFNVLEMSRIIALIRPENEPSIKVAERIGMIPALGPGMRTQYAGFEHVIYAIECESGSILIERVPRTAK